MRSRRDFLKLLLAAPIAATVDVEKLLWVPTPMVTVPAMPWLVFHRDAFAFVMKDMPLDEMQRRYNYYRSLEMELVDLKPKAPFPLEWNGYRLDVIQPQTIIWSRG